MEKWTIVKKDGKDYNQEGVIIKGEIQHGDKIVDFDTSESTRHK